MNEINVILERYEQRLKILERDIRDLREVQAEIRSMNEALVTLATELKHTNEHLARHEQKIDAIENQPKQRMQQITTAIIAALAGGLISAIISMLLA
ncbi:MAG: hypothetical protein ACLSVG_00855 [Clostridia bacterium]